MQKLARLKVEMGMLTKNPPPGIHCWQDDNSDIIQVELIGPPGSPYEKGTFRVEVTLGDRYPFAPPGVRFLTQIYHPNIDPNGRVCLAALKPKPSGNWTVMMNIPIILGAIRILLAEPNLSDALMTDIAKEYLENFESFRVKATEDTLKYAVKKTVRASLTSVSLNKSDEDTVDEDKIEDKVDKNFSTKLYDEVPMSERMNTTENKEEELGETTRTYKLDGSEDEIIESSKPSKKARLELNSGESEYEENELVQNQSRECSDSDSDFQ